ncbi:MAG: hypothetical protein ABJF10_16940, partial [Chthoniobacter sp.]|uniref:phage portal protein family protein n=1 Tax=Chthoniobacter sp. TaxID=2510640 RepID=UPI0032A9221C
APQATVDQISTMLQNMGSSSWSAFPSGTTLEVKAEGQKSGSATPQGDLLDRADKHRNRSQRKRCFEPSFHSTSAIRVRWFLERLPKSGPDEKDE